MIILRDTIALDASSFKDGKLPRRKDGSAAIKCPVARAGIQDYLAYEMGEAFADRDPNSVVRVYRPEDVIFADKSLAGYAHRYITNDHPPEPVTAENSVKYARGWTGSEVTLDGKKIWVDMLLSDAATIRDAESGKVQWSAGYGVTFDVCPGGVAPDGTLCDAIVTGQEINHIALVDRARAGPEFRIGDSNRRTTTDPIEGDRRMAEVKMTFDGVPFAVADATAEAVVGKIISARDAAVTRAETAEASVATLTTSVQAKDAEIATLKQAVEDAKVTPAQLRDAAAAYAKVLADAKRIAPDLTFSDDATDAAIKAAVVNAKLGDAAKGWTEAQLDTSFATMAASLGDSQDDGIQRVISDGVTTRNLTDYDKAQAAYVARLTGKKDA